MSQEEVTVKISTLDQRTESLGLEVSMIVDTGVNRTLLLEESWLGLKLCEVFRPPKLKTNRGKLVPLGTNGRQKCIGRSMVKIKVTTGAVLSSTLKVVKL